MLAPETGSLWLEIGFGGGEHLAWQAAANTDVTHLGVEPYLNGVASLLAQAETSDLFNVRVVVDDARLVLDALPVGCLARAHVLFPDPWPKARHHRRRILNTRTASRLADLLEVGGELRMATDDADYAAWILEVFQGERRLRWLARRAQDFRSRTADWPATRYEAKALAAGRKPVYLRFQRVP